MELRFKFNLLPEFLPGEKVLHLKKWVWRVSCKSLPTYRLFFSLPPLWEAGLYITDRRMVLVAHFLRLLKQELSLWFPGKSHGDGCELLQHVSAWKSPLFGSYLELISEESQKRWYRSPELRLRLYMRHPESIQRFVNEVKGTNRDRG